MTTNKSKKTTKNMTPKQLHLRVGTLLRGIDNNTTSIKKFQAKLDTNTQELKKTVEALSKIETKPIAKPAAKAAKPAKVAAKKPAKIKAAKPAKAKAAKPATDRPQLKTAVQDLLQNDKKIPKKDILEVVSSKWGYSRPALSNMLKKNSDIFSVDSDQVVSLVSKEKTEPAQTPSEDVEVFVRNVEQDSVVSQAV